MQHSRMIGRVLYLALFVQFAFAVCPHRDANLIPWSSWSRRPLTPNQDVTINPSENILLDVDPPLINKLNIEGTLVFNDVDLTVNSHFIFVRSGGHLWIGSEDCQLESKIVINLHGSKAGDTNLEGMGSKVLGVFNGGQIDIHGRIPSSTWSVLSSTVSPGARTINLAQEVDWRVGDEIIVATTDFEPLEPYNPNYPQTQNERRTITARPTPTSIEVSEPFVYTHWGQTWQGGEHLIDTRGEVGLLTRRVVIRGALSGSDLADGWGGHVIVWSGGQLRIQGTELSHMGQTGREGRYPIHFHLARDQSLSWVRSNAIHTTFQRCVTIHGTNNVHVSDNVAYNAKGHCFFIEDGDEINNVFERNLAIRSTPMSLLSSDEEPSMFWITNAWNHFYDNVAVGGKFGFWYAMPEHPLGFADPARRLFNFNRFAPMGDFLGNKAHSTSDSGLFVDRGQANNEGDVTELTSYNPRNWTISAEWYPSTREYLDSFDEYRLSTFGIPIPAVFRDFTAYKNIRFGMWGRGSYLYATGAKLIDNQVGCSWPGEYNFVLDSVIAGESNNVGYSACIQCWWGNEGGRHRPLKYWLDHPIIGYQNYDAGGGDVAIEIDFFNFKDEILPNGRTRKSGAIGGQIGPNALQPRNKFFRLTFTEVDNNVFFYDSIPSFETGQLTYLNTADMDNAMKGVVLVDTDGSITGNCGSQILGSSPVLRNSGCLPRSAWNAYICPNNVRARRAFSLTDESYPYDVVDDVSSVVRTRTNGYLHRLDSGSRAVVQLDADFFDRYDLGTTPYLRARYRYNSNLIANGEYLFLIGNAGFSLNHQRIGMWNAPVGEWIRVAIPYPSGTTFSVTRDWDNKPVTQVASKGELTINTYFYDASSSLLWVHLETETNNFVFVDEFPFYATAAFVTVQATCSQTPCTQIVNPASLPGGSTNGPTADLCESGGNAINYIPINGGRSYTIFGDSVHPDWTNSTSACERSQELVADGTHSLRCAFDNSGHYLYRNYQTRETDVPASDYTHFEFKARTAPGYGQVWIGVSFGTHEWEGLKYVSTTNPSYSPVAIDETEWRTFRIPIADLGLDTYNNIFSVSFSTYSRPMIVYLDSVAFRSYSTSPLSNPQFPSLPTLPGLEGPGRSQEPFPVPPPEDEPIDAAGLLGPSLALLLALSLLLC